MGQFSQSFLNIKFMLTVVFTFHLLLLSSWVKSMSRLLSRASSHVTSDLLSRLKELYLFNHFTQLSAVAVAYVNAVKHLGPWILY